MADIENAPFSEWLESAVRDLYDLEPTCIAMGMRDAEGQVYTSYWQMDANDMACVIDALQNEATLNFIKANKDEILSILNGEGDEDDGLPETATDPAESG